MTITLRATKGSPLTHGEMDDNLVTLRDVASQTSGSINNVIIGASTAAAGNFTSLTAAAGTFSGNVILGDAASDTVTVNGYMGVGGAAATNVGMYVRNAALSGTGQYGILSAPISTSAATASTRAFLSSPATAAAAYTSSIVSGYHCADATKGAGSTITSLHGVYIEDQTQGTNNYGITSAVSSGTNKWNIYASGTAANYFAGNVGIGVTPSAWSSGYKVMQIGAQGVYASGSNITHVATNYYRSAALADTYISSDFASKYTQEGLTHKWYSAPSGTAGNTITFTQVLAVEKDKSVALQGATSQTGAGITFPATQSASSDANTLDDYREATFTATATGMTTSPTGTVTFVRVGNLVTMDMPAISGTSNSTTFTLTGGPTVMRPSAPRVVGVRVSDNGGATQWGVATIGTDGVITLYTGSAGAFTASGTKSVGPTNFSYIL